MNKNKFKNLLFGLGSSAAVITTAVAVISCGTQKPTETKKPAADATSNNVENVEVEGETTATKAQVKLTLKAAVQSQVKYTLTLKKGELTKSVTATVEATKKETTFVFENNNVLTTGEWKVDSLKETNGSEQKSAVKDDFKVVVPAPTAA